MHLRAAVNMVQTCIGFMSSVMGQSKEGQNAYYSDKRSSVGAHRGRIERETKGRRGTCQPPASSNYQGEQSMAYGVMGLIRTPLKRQVSVLKPHCETARVLSMSMSARVILTLRKTHRCRRGCSNSDKAPWGTRTENKPFFRDDHACMDLIS